MVHLYHEADFYAIDSTQMPNAIHLNHDTCFDIMVHRILLQNTLCKDVIMNIVCKTTEMSDSWFKRFLHLLGGGHYKNIMPGFVTTLTPHSISFSSGLKIAMTTLDTTKIYSGCVVCITYNTGDCLAMELRVQSWINNDTKVFICFPSTRFTVNNSKKIGWEDVDKTYCQQITSDLETLSLASMIHT